MKKLVNLRDHCLPDSVYRQTRKSVNHLKQPYIGIQPGFMPPAVAISGSAHTSSPSKESADRGITFYVASAVSSPKLSIVEEDWWFQNFATCR
jgi:hypothetical protein